MGIEFFIAKRTAQSKGSNKPSVMVRVATISVALSVAIMILSLSIIFGFKREVSESITGFTAEAILTDVATLRGAQNRPIKLNPELEEFVKREYYATKVSPYATLQGVVRSAEAIEGVMLRGVDSLYDLNFMERALTAGELPRLAESSTTRDLLISSSLASKLGLGVGDRLELIINQENQSLRRDMFKICGLYSTGLDQWDRMVLVTDIANVQRLNGWSSDEISGYELNYPTLKQAELYCSFLNAELYESSLEGIENIYAFSTEQLYPSIFDWLKAHDVNALVIIIIMLIVAGFNMATALLIMVLERTRMIGLLKSLGMNNSALQKIFLYRSFWITLNGLAWGNGVALLLCSLQHHFHFIKLDAQSYLLSHIPIELGAWWIIGLNLAVVAAIVALMILPTRIVGRIKIEKSLKFN